MKSLRQKRIYIALFYVSSFLLWSPQILAATCNLQATLEAKQNFKQLSTEFVKEASLTKEEEFRQAASDYITLAEQCYQEEQGVSAIGTLIDEGGVMMNSNSSGFSVESHVLFGNKWGAGSPYTGGEDATGPRLPGGEVSYSFMADGVDLSAEGGSPGLNVAITSLPTFSSCFLDEIRDSFAAWSAVSNILFRPVSDNGVAFDASGATGDIRIGAHAFDGVSGSLAHGFFPPPNGNTAAGDIHFDKDEPWVCSPEAGSIGLGIVALHEIGHAIGLSHETTDVAVMNPFYNGSLTFGPLADDIIGAGEIYGAAGTAATTFIGPVTIGTDTPASGAILHVKTETNVGVVDLFRLENNSAARIKLINTSVANSTVNQQEWTINSNGSLRISAGNDAAEMQLDAAGNMRVSGGIIVAGTMLNVPDYVFSPEYKLQPLDELKTFIETNKHLPHIPSARTVFNDGLNMTQMQMKLLQKVEELTLYTLQQHQMIKYLKANQNPDLARRIEELEVKLLDMQRHSVNQEKPILQ